LFFLVSWSDPFDMDYLAKRLKLGTQPAEDLDFNIHRSRQQRILVGRIDCPAGPDMDVVGFHQQSGNPGSSIHATRRSEFLGRTQSVNRGIQSQHTLSDQVDSFQVGNRRNIGVVVFQRYF